VLTARWWCRLYSSSAWRFGNTLRGSVSTLVDYKVCFFLREHWSGAPKDLMQRCHDRAGKRIADTALRNGGLYIKFGQTIGSLNNILPDA